MKISIIFILGVLVGYVFHSVVSTIEDTTSTLFQPISKDNNTNQQSTPQHSHTTQPMVQTHTTQVTTPKVAQAQITKPTSATKSATDNTALKLMSQIQRLMGEESYTEAFVKIEELLFQIQDTYSKSEIEAIFVNAVTKQRTQKLVNDLAAQIELLNYATTIVPEHKGFIFDLAIIFFKLGNIENAKYYLSLISYDVNWQEKTAKLLADIEYQELFSSGDIQIPLLPKHNAWHIEVIINNQLVILILDTGATTTVIRDSLVTPNYKKLKKVLVYTANGQVDAYTTKVSLTVGSIQNKEFEVLVLQDNKLPSEVDGLLGVDFLNNYHFIIDKTNNMLQLSPIQ